jgi:hypothetical protein
LINDKEDSQNGLVFQVVPVMTVVARDWLQVAGERF